LLRKTGKSHVGVKKKGGGGGKKKKKGSPVASPLKKGGGVGEKTKRAHFAREEKKRKKTDSVG